MVSWKNTEKVTITWHLDSVNVGFFETITDRQDVRHLCRGNILTFPPVGSHKLQLHVYCRALYTRGETKMCKFIHVEKKSPDKYCEQTFSTSKCPIKQLLYQL